jgi:hypothetical protein
MSGLYFAYGSNLKPARMRGRIPGARDLGPARLPGHALRLDKRSSDGSGKANLAEDASGCVWGALYAIEAADWPVLDRFESGYARVAVEVVTPGGERLPAQTYVAERLTSDPVPFDWYKRLIVEGAREHGLPESWIAWLERLPERPDPRGQG